MEPEEPPPPPAPDACSPDATAPGTPVSAANLLVAPTLPPQASRARLLQRALEVTGPSPEDRPLPLRPLLVGEDNPYGQDPRYALFPLPTGASGARLREILGLSLSQYLGGFDRLNLCAGKWSQREARAHANRWRKVWEEEPRAMRPGVVLLGVRVAAAFGLDPAPFRVQICRGAVYYLLPHPSGRNRAWNGAGRVEQARGVLRPLLAEVGGGGR